MQELNFIAISGCFPLLPRLRGAGAVGTVTYTDGDAGGNLHLQSSVCRADQEEAEPELTDCGAVLEGSAVKRASLYLCLTYYSQLIISFSNSEKLKKSYDFICLPSEVVTPELR